MEILRFPIISSSLIISRKTTIIINAKLSKLQSICNNLMLVSNAQHVMCRDNWGQCLEISMCPD